MTTVEQTNTPQLQGQIRSAYKWTIAGNLGKHVVGLGLSVLLARLLQPRDYGLLGMVWVFVTILQALQDLGFGQAIVHFHKDDESVMPTYWSTTFLLGMTLAALNYLAAPLVADFYHEPRLTALLRALSAVFVLSSFTSVGTGIMTRSFRFRELTIIETVATVVGGIVAVVMAFRGFGVWSLVANLLVYGFVQAGLMCRAVPPRATMHLRKDVLTRVLRYGLPLTGAGMLHQFYDNADYLVVGRMAGAVSLGYYTLAFRLATMAHEKISVVVNKVAFPSFAAMQHDTHEVVEHWFAVSRAVSLINFPLMLMLFVNAKDVLFVVFGEKWQPAVVPLRFLCVVGLLRSLVHVILHIFSALGKTNSRLQFGILNAVLMPVAFVIGCKYWGLAGVGLAWCVTYPIIWLFVLYKVRAILPFSYWQYINNLRLPIMVTLLCLIVMLPAELIHSSPLIRLVTRSILGGAAFTLFVLSRRRIRTELLSLIRRKTQPPATAVAVR